MTVEAKKEKLKSNLKIKSEGENGTLNESGDERAKKKENQSEKDKEARIITLETAKARLEQKIENRERRYELGRKPLKPQDRETLDILHSIDSQKAPESLEEKNQKINLLLIIGPIVVLKLNDKGLKLNLSEFKNFHDFADEIKRENSKLSNDIDITALTKLTEIASSPTSPYYKELAKRWPMEYQKLTIMRPAIDEAKSYFTSSTPTLAPNISSSPTHLSPQTHFALSTPPTLSVPPALITPPPLSALPGEKKFPEKEVPKEKNFIDTVKDFTSQPYGKVLTGLLAAGGAFCVYKLLSDKNEKNTESKEKPEGKEKSDLLDKALDSINPLKHPFRLALSAIFIAGAIIGHEKIISWLKEKLPFGWESISNALGAIIQGKDSNEVVSTLIAPSNNNQGLYQKSIETIKKETQKDIKPATLEQIGQVKFLDFQKRMSSSSSDLTRNIENGLKEKAQEVLAPIKEIPVLGSALDNYLAKNLTTENEEELKALNAFFLTHQSELTGKITSQTTINEALALISHFPTPKEIGKSSQIENKIYNLDQRIRLSENEQTSQEVEKTLNTLSAKLDNEQKKEIFNEFHSDIGNRWLEPIEIQAIISGAQKNGISSLETEKSLKERTEAMNQLLEVMRTHSSPEILAEKMEKVLEANDKVGHDLSELKGETLKKTGWSEEIYLSFIQAPTYIRRYLQTPPLHREYAKYLLSKYTVGTASQVIDTGKEIYKKMTKPETSLAQSEEQIATLEQKKARINEAKQSYFRSDGTQTELHTDLDRMRKDHHFQMADLVDQDLEIAKKTHALKLQQGELTQLQETLAGLPKDADSQLRKTEMEGKIKKLQEAITQEQATLDSLTSRRVKLKNDELKTKLTLEHQNFKERIGTGKNITEIHKEDFKRMDELVGEIEAHRKYLDTEIAQKLLKAEKLPAGKEQKKLVEEIVQLQLTKTNFDLKGFDLVEGVHRKWRTDWDNFRALKGGSQSAEAKKYVQSEQAKLKIWFNQVLGTAEHQANLEKAATKPLINTFKGNILFYGAMIGVGSLLNYDHKKGGSFWASVGQTAIDIMPVTGTVSDFYAAWKGNEMITGSKLDTTDRAFRTIFGFGGALCDLASIAGLGLIGRRTLDALKETKALSKSITLREALEAARASGKEVKNIEALKFMKESGKWGFKLGLTGALGLAGYSLIYQPLAMRTLSPETQALLNEQIQETDLEPPKMNSPLSN